VRGQTGNGAKLRLFSGAIKALRSRRIKRLNFSFPASFSLVHFFWRSKRNEQQICGEQKMNRNFRRTKEPIRRKAESSPQANEHLKMINYNLITLSNHGRSDTLCVTKTIVTFSLIQGKKIYYI